MESDDGGHRRRLTVYDMVKASTAERSPTCGLLEKHGGRSGDLVLEP
jgi:hypothetical protein